MSGTALVVMGLTAATLAAVAWVEGAPLCRRWRERRAQRLDELRVRVPWDAPHGFGSLEEPAERHCTCCDLALPEPGGRDPALYARVHEMVEAERAKVREAEETRDLATEGERRAWRLVDEERARRKAAVADYQRVCEELQAEVTLRCDAEAERDRLLKEASTGKAAHDAMARRLLSDGVAGVVLPSYTGHGIIHYATLPPGGPPGPG